MLKYCDESANDNLKLAVQDGGPCKAVSNKQANANLRERLLLKW